MAEVIISDIYSIVTVPSVNRLLEQSPTAADVVENRLHDPAGADEAAAAGAPAGEQRADEDDDAADPAGARDAQVGHVVAVVVQEGPVARQPSEDEELRMEGFVSWKVWVA